MDQQPQQPGATPQYSTDGKWWWDGQQWVPAEQRSAPPAASAPRRRRRWPFVVGGLVALLVVFSVCMAAISASTPSQSTSRTATANSAAPARSAAASAKPATAAAPGRDGSCAPQPCANDNYGWIVTVSNVHYGAPGGSYTQPEAGNVFVTMDVTFTNRLDQEQHANPTSFVLKDGAGIKHQVRFFLDGPCATWEPVNVTKGAAFGPKCIAFEAAADKPAGLVLIWTPGGFGGDYDIKLS